ncbi:WecB/TagA/CpsF family glycosyltransferase [Lentisphaera profundi]|uniref:WecB/TagA/CpsF family glycosyltransferase n=1 Tax=Lentisphaera profundi TaxID=1658616 RepID=A0ABY7VWE2_9BACT|nr:WecB/TagA/CpsF family glycosyltransferase [Lentisphaera profundi]WDE98555.1 WecB/TagA/CpsF family glycosyltransferase [Lentisphaera profundi]
MIITNTDIFKIPVSTLNKTETINAIHELVRRYEREAKAQYVATLNMDFLANCFHTFSLKVKNQELYETLQTADLVTADGMPIVCLGKMKNASMKERVTGADLVFDIAKYSALLGHKIFYIGESKKLCKRAHVALKEQYPRLNAAGFASPMVSDVGEILDDVGLIEKINNSGAKILLLGLGNPKQEMFFRRYKKDLKIPVSIGIGGSYNFISGRVLRAPKLLQNIGMEWAYRLCKEPGKLWKRYFSQILLLISFMIHGRLNILKFLGYHLFDLQKGQEVLDGSIRVMGRLNDKMVENIYQLFNECKFTTVALSDLTLAEGHSLWKLRKICRIYGVELIQAKKHREHQKPRQWLRRKTKSLITRVM